MSVFLTGIFCLAGGFIGGYLTCYFWGKSRKTIKESTLKAAEKLAKQ